MTDRRNKDRYKVKDRVMLRIIKYFKIKLIERERYKKK